MRVMVIRHAIAEDRERFAETGDDDALRPLTRAGVRRMRRGARGLRRVVPNIEALASSPLLRATRTAELVSRAYGGRKVDHLGQLAPSKPVTSLMHWLQQQPKRATIAIVGHEPQLGTFVGWALTGLQEPLVELKKGGACLIEFERDVKPGRAKLLWSMRPSHLREIGR